MVLGPMIGDTGQDVGLGDVEAGILKLGVVSLFSRLLRVSKGYPKANIVVSRRQDWMYLFRGSTRSY